MARFGEKLRHRRTQKSLSIYSIAKATGISHANLIAIEKGRRPASDEVMQKLAAISELELTVDDMLAWKAIDEFGPDILRQALNMLDKNSS